MHSVYCFISCFTGSSLQGMDCTVSHFAWLVHNYRPCIPWLVPHYWAWFVLFHFKLHWFIFTVNGLYCFMSYFTSSLLLGMDCIISFHFSLVLPYYSWFKLLCLMFPWLSISGPGLYCLIACLAGLYFVTSCITGSSLFGMVFIPSLDAAMVDDFWAGFVLFHFASWFFLTGHGLYFFSFHALLVHHYSALFVFI